MSSRQYISLSSSDARVVGAMLRSALVVSFLAGGSSPAQTPMTRSASVSRSIETPVAVPPFTVRVVGHGRPIILIPGLMSGPDVWDATVAHLQGRYELHIVHLAGFAGAPASAGADLLGRARAGLLAYAAELHSATGRRPVIVGHSLGGFLAYALASAAPDAFDGIVAVDGVPFLAAMRDTSATADAMRQTAAGMRAMFSTMSGAQLAAQTRAGLPMMMRDTSNIERATEWARTSDGSAVGQAMAEMLTTDLRPIVSAIRVPVLQIAAGGAATTPQARAMLRGQYEAQIASVPHHDLIVAERAYHFIMLDDPTFFQSTLDAFLARVDARSGGSDR